MFCPIAFTLLDEEASVAPDGRTYSKTALDQWRVKSNTSPFTRFPLEDRGEPDAHDFDSRTEEKWPIQVEGKLNLHRWKKVFKFTNFYFEDI